MFILNYINYFTSKCSKFQGNYVRSTDFPIFILIPGRENGLTEMKVGIFRPEIEVNIPQNRSIQVSRDESGIFRPEIGVNIPQTLS